MNKDHVLLIGASSSIGLEIIRLIARENMVVLAQFRSNARGLNELSKTIPASIVPMRADLESEADIESMLKLIEERCPFPDKIVFLAAPKLVLVRFKDLHWSEFQKQLDVQLRASVQVCRRFLPKMASAKTGKLVFVLSSYTLGMPPAAMAHYISAKYALLGLMKALASEYSTRGICVNAVSPSMVETEFLSNIPTKIVEFAADQHPLKRNATPNDVAPAVAFFLSNEARYITGVNLPITGGSV